MTTHRKNFGQYFTPSDVSASLVSWVITNPRERLLDPSCGDGQFLVHHKRSVGVELDAAHAAVARQRAPGALIHGGDFFSWACSTKERFDAVAGNPPFIRYQAFTGKTRAQALAAASMLGAEFNQLTSSWAPFILVAGGLLKPGGRMAFVVPAEIGHANYAKVLLPALCNHFGQVHLIAFREKLFPDLSEDCWLLVCSGAGSRTSRIGLSAVRRFEPMAVPPKPDRHISLSEWAAAGERIRPFLLSRKALSLYQGLKDSSEVREFGELAAANIGYVSGANEFFHLRPTDARRFRIPDQHLRVTIRKSNQLSRPCVDQSAVDEWLKDDQPVLLLDLNGVEKLEDPVSNYLHSEPAEKAKASYKCRNRKPWYAVPDVKIPDGFLTVMNGRRPSLIQNRARCACTNSLHAVTLKPGIQFSSIKNGWESTLAELGAEIEGHPLGGGMLKLEPREATRIPIPTGKLSLSDEETAILMKATETMRKWRHQNV